MQVLKDDIRNNILEQAEQLFYIHGFSATSTRMIAEKTGMHYSSMYRYFANKTALFEAVIGEFCRKFKTGFSGFMETRDDHAPVKERINDLELTLFSAVKNDRKKFVILLRRSRGTAYESVFSELVEMLKSHIVEEMSVEADQQYTAEVIARNFFKGVSDIAERCEDLKALRTALSSFIGYHLSGMASFM